MSREKEKTALEKIVRDAEDQIAYYNQLKHPTVADWSKADKARQHIRFAYQQADSLCIQLDV
jgi:hypothetical protein